MGIFTTECTNCGSKDHATRDCPHGIFSDGKCKYCGSTEHASSDCPHGIFSDGKCKYCGSVNHSSDNCPQGVFSSGKCKYCGSTEHASSDCPHGILSEGKCKYCGSVNHSSSECPHGVFGKSKTSYQSPDTSSQSENSGCGAIIAWLIGGAIAIAVAIWLAVNIVFPIVLLNSALACMILALVFKRLRILFAIVAIVGGAYMLVDIINGWFSLNFVNKIVKDTIWISIFVYINTIAVGVCTGLLVRPLWLKAKKVKSTDKSAGIILIAVSAFLILLTTSSIPLVYNLTHNPLSRNMNYTNNNDVVSNQPNYSNNVPNSNYGNNTVTNNSSIPGKYPQASERLLTASDLSALSKEELRIMRNEIFARYGYIFKTPEMKSYFSQQSWYQARYDDVSSHLTSIEHTNIALIKKYE